MKRLSRALIVATACSLFPACAELPNGGSTASLVGSRPALLHAMSDNGIVVVQVLILQPRGSSVGWNGSSFELGFAKATETFTWDRNGSRYAVSLVYHGFDREFEVAGKRWSTEGGNVFVVDLDQSWVPTVRPLALKLASVGRAEALARIQSTVPDDADIAGLRFQ